MSVTHEIRLIGEMSLQNSILKLTASILLYSSTPWKSLVRNNKCCFRQLMGVLKLKNVQLE